MQLCRLQDTDSDASITLQYDSGRKDDESDENYLCDSYD